MMSDSNVKRSIVVDPSGAVRLVELGAAADVLAVMYRELACDAAEPVVLDGDELVMWVDEEGFRRESFVVNRWASLVAGEFGRTRQPYPGAALFCANTPNGDEADLSPALLVELLSFLGHFGADVSAAQAQAADLAGTVADHG
ncbi:hypothetical protein TSHO111613_16690 [Tsukamurella hominis]